MVMAVDVCYSEISSTGISPRVSFSYDLNQTEDDHRGIRLDSSILETGSDFDFCVGSANGTNELPSADELFSNGKILPVQIKEQETIASKKRIQIQRSASLSSSAGTKTEKKRLKELLLMSPETDHEEEEKASSKPFWKFKRSFSLNNERTRTNKGLMKSLHFLTRSNSTGSALNPNKPNVLPKETTHQKQSPQRQPSVSRKSSSNQKHHHHHQPKRAFGAYNGNGVCVSPVLNFPPPSFISNATVGFFGFGLLFCNGKSTRKKK